MKYQLSGAEARVVGCLLEKQVTTPEQYPLSVNAVMMACNQKTNREPVMNLSEHDVQDVLDELVKRHYLRTVSGFGNRVTKYEQRFCNSEFGDLKLSAAEVAVITTFYCAGHRLPASCAHGLPVCMSLRICRKWNKPWKGLQPARMALTWCVWREPGKRESRYMHLFSGEVDTATLATEQESTVVSGSLTARVDALEEEVAGLKQRLDALLAHLGD